MYINIEKAQRAGLLIEITENKMGDKFLTMYPENSSPPELDGIKDQLTHVYDLDDSTSHQILDDLCTAIHHATRRKVLKRMDQK